MSYELKALLHNDTGNHDKIWGYVTAGDNVFVFWGRRQVMDRDGMTTEGKRPSLQFKQHSTEVAADNLAFQKMRKGYKRVSVEQPDESVPGFTEFFEHALVEARLLGKVRSDEWLAV